MTTSLTFNAELHQGVVSFEDDLGRIARDAMKLDSADKESGSFEIALDGFNFGVSKAFFFAAFGPSVLAAGSVMAFNSKFSFKDIKSKRLRNFTTYATEILLQGHYRLKGSY